MGIIGKMYHEIGLNVTEHLKAVADRGQWTRHETLLVKELARRPDAFPEAAELYQRVKSGQVPIVAASKQAEITLSSGPKRARKQAFSGGKQPNQLRKALKAARGKAIGISIA